MTLERIRAAITAARNQQAAITARISTESRTLTDAEIGQIDALDGQLASLEASERVLVQQERHASALASEPARPRGISGKAPAVLTKTTQAQRNGDKFQGQTWARIHLAKLASA